MKSLLSFVFIFIFFSSFQAQFINMPDAAFKTAVLHPYWGYDMNNDQEIDSAEALLIDTLTCQDLNVFSTTGIEAFSNLVFLHCGENNINSLDLSHNPLLTNVYANQNSLTYLNVTGCSQLKELILYFNNIPKLDVSTCVNLEKLDVVLNSIDSLDLTNNPAIYSLDCFSNSMEYLNVANGNNTNITHFFGDWNLYDCITVDDPAYSYANWVGFSYIFDSTTIFSTDCSTLGVSDLLASIQFDIAPNPALDFAQITTEVELNFSIVSTQGQIVKKGQLMKGENMISLIELNSGIYFFRAENEQNVSKSLRFVKQ